MSSARLYKRLGIAAGSIAMSVGAWQSRKGHSLPESGASHQGISLFSDTSIQCQGCNDTIPESLRLPKIHSGKDYTVYEDKMDAVYGKQPEVFEDLFKKHVAEYNNISGSVIHFPSGDKHVYRSAMLAFSPDTLQELVTERNVKTIIHLSNKKTVNQALWTHKEKAIFIQLGGKLQNYIHIKDFDYIFNDDDELTSGKEKVAEIIHLIEKCEGNVLIHCLGGEHKTGLIFEIMQKCYNRVGMENITERYKCHTAWSADPAIKSGYKQNNIDFIRSYPCKLLQANIEKDLLGQPRPRP